MYGNHPYKKAVQIAKQKTKETGEEHIVVEAEDAPNLYTIGVPIKAITIDELLARIKGNG